MPDNTRQRRLEDIHSAALKRDVSGRDEFLRQACGGDMELRWSAAAPEPARSPGGLPRRPASRRLSTVFDSMVLDS